MLDDVADVEYFQDQAKVARQSAESAPLANVREKYLHSGEIWLALAARAQRVRNFRTTRVRSTNLNS